MCSRSGSPSRLPVLASARRASPPGPETKAWRSRQSGQSWSRSAGEIRPSSPVMLEVQVGSRRGGSSRSRSRSPKMTSSAVRAEWMWTTSPSASSRSRLAQHAHDRRDPAAGADEEELLAAAGRGATKVPSTPPRRTMSPGRAWRTRNGETTAVVDQLRRDRRCSRRGGRDPRSASRRASGGRRRPRRRSAGTGRAGAPATRSRDGSATVTASAVSRSIRSIRPRSSCVDQSGLISSR